MEDYVKWFKEKYLSNFSLIITNIIIALIVAVFFFGIYAIIWLLFQQRENFRFLQALI